MLTPQVCAGMGSNYEQHAYHSYILMARSQVSPLSRELPSRARPPQLRAHVTVTQLNKNTPKEWPVTDTRTARRDAEKTARAALAVLQQGDGLLAGFVDNGRAASSPTRVSTYDCACGLSR